MLPHKRNLDLVLAFCSGGIKSLPMISLSFLPAVGNEMVWGLAFSMYSVILGHLGEDIVAANSVVNVVRNLGTVLVFGMAYGGAIVLGKYMGADNLK